MNRAIQVYRIFATILICTLHYQLAFPFYPLIGGQSYVMVDFFCIISGYLIAVKHGEKKKNYILKRFCSLYFVYIIPVISLGLYSCIRNKYTIRGSIGYFLEHTLELCMADWAVPAMPNRIIPVLWYVPVLFFATFIAWECLKHYGTAFGNLGSILIALFIYNSIYVNTGNLDIWYGYSRFYFGDGLLRVTAGVFAGVFCHTVVRSVNELKFDGRFKVLLGVLSFVLQNVIFLLILFDRWIWGDFLYLFLTIVNVVLAFWSELRIPGGKILKGLSELTYPAYASHFFVIELMRIYFPDSYRPVLTGFIYVAGVLLCAFLVQAISRVLFRGMNLQLNGTRTALHK